MQRKIPTKSNNSISTQLPFQSRSTTCKAKVLETFLQNPLETDAEFPRRLEKQSNQIVYVLRKGNHWPLGGGKSRQSFILNQYYIFSLKRSKQKQQGMGGILHKITVKDKREKFSLSI